MNVSEISAVVKFKEQGLDKVERGIKKIENAAHKASSASEKLAGKLNAAFNIAAITAFAKGVASVADKWHEAESKISVATDNLKEQQHIQERLYKLAQQTSTEYADNVELFKQLHTASSALGIDNSGVLDLSQAIGVLSKAGGAGAAEAAAVAKRMAKALSEGEIKAAELKAIMDKTPLLGREIAELFGVGTDKLYEMAKAGNLTSKEIAHGLIRNAERLSKKYGDGTRNFGDGLTRIRNAIGYTIHKINSATQASEYFNMALDLIGDNITYITSLIGVMVGASILGKAGGLSALIAANVGKIAFVLGAALRSLLLWGAPLAAAALVLEDIYFWLTGGQSVLGLVLGDSKQWLGIISEIVQPFKDVFNTIAATVKELISGVDTTSALGAVASVLGAAFAAAAVGVNTIVSGLSAAYSTASALASLLRGDLSGAGNAIGAAKNKIIAAQNLNERIIGKATGGSLGSVNVTNNFSGGSKSTEAYKARNSVPNMPTVRAR